MTDATTLIFTLNIHKQDKYQRAKKDPSGATHTKTRKTMIYIYQKDHDGRGNKTNWAMQSLEMSQTHETYTDIHMSQTPATYIHT